MGALLLALAKSIYYPCTKGTQRWFPPTYIENTLHYPEYF